jgi:hypothetical protein
MNDSLIIESQYFGSIDFYKTSINFTHWKIEVYERWQKALPLNRCYLLGPNGPLLLSVPLEAGRAQKGPFKDVRISYREHWGLRHWRSIHDAYKKSPWFEHYVDTLQPLFEQRPDYLLDWNKMTMEWVLTQLNWKGEIEEAKGEYPEAKDRRGHSKLKPEMDVPYTYTQVFGDRHAFIGNLSILDLLFCEGPVASRKLLG